MYFSDRLGGVMVTVLASSAEGRGFDPRPGQTKDIKIDWSAQSQNNVSGKVACLPADCYFVELAY